MLDLWFVRNRDDELDVGHRLNPIKVQAAEILSSPAEREDALNHSEDSDDKKESRREGEDDNGNRDDPGGVPAAPLSSSKVWKRDPGAILLSALTAGAKEWWEHQKELLKEASNESKEAREQETNRGS